MDLGGHLARPVKFRLVSSKSRFEVQHNECVKDVVSEEGEQQETLDGIRLVPIHVVRMPAVDQFIKPMVLDIPALVAQCHDLPGPSLRRGQGGHPDPIAVQGSFLFGDLTLH